MNIAYLTKILDTESLEEVVTNFDGAPLDMNLAIWDAEKRGEIQIDREADTIKVLKEIQPESDEDLRHKILRVIQHYASTETNITRGRLNTQVKDPATGKGYAWHEYICAVQHLIDDGTVVQDVIDVPEGKRRFTTKKGKVTEKVIRPAHKFAFLCLPENSEQNAEWNAKSVNEWIAVTEAEMLK